MICDLAGGAAKLAELCDEAGLVLEAAQIEDQPPGLDMADDRHRQHPQAARQLLDGAAGRRQRL